MSGWISVPTYLEPPSAAKISKGKKTKSRQPGKRRRDSGLSQRLLI